jgi:hypothetical protein
MKIRSANGCDGGVGSPINYGTMSGTDKKIGEEGYLLLDRNL